MRAAGAHAEGIRLRGVIVVLWRWAADQRSVGVERDHLDRVRGSILVRRGKGGYRREVGMDQWAWDQLDPWLQLRARLPVGALSCVLRGQTRGGPCSSAGIRSQLHAVAQTAGVRRRFAPHHYADTLVMPMSLPLESVCPAQRVVGTWGR